MPCFFRGGGWQDKTKTMKNIILLITSLLLPGTFALGAGVTHDFVEVRRTSSLPFIDFSRDSSTDFHARIGIYADNWLGILGANVGIGTNSPDYKLDVNGTIRTKEIIVETGWADFVFDSGYELAPLEEVEDFIAQNGHLPGIPSGEEIETGGLKLAEMQALMMAKIEELTLHLIEQKKRVDKLEAENAALKARVEGK